MNGKWRKGAAVIGVSLLFSSGMTRAQAAWRMDFRGWTYEDQGKRVPDGWRNIEGAWYLFGKDGYMATGWYQETPAGDWFFLHTEGDGQGKMASGWNWIDGRCYYFDLTSGRMLINEMTPDGFFVGETGAWTVDGKIQSAPGKGVKTKPELAVGRGLETAGSSGRSLDRGVSKNIASEHGSPDYKNPDSEPSGAGASGIDLPGNEFPGNELPGIGSSGIEPSGNESPGDEPPRNEPPEGIAPGTPGGQGALQYVIYFKDIETKEIMKRITGVGARGTAVPFDFPEMGGYVVCAGQKNSFDLVNDCQEFTVWCERHTDATASNADRVSWMVFFVDAEHHDQEIMEGQAGVLKTGERLEITFPETLTGADGYRWSSVESSPWSVVPDGSGTQKYFIEYRRGESLSGTEDGEAESDPNHGKLRAWIQAAKETNCRLSGAEAGQAADSAVIVTNRRANDEMVAQLASMAAGCERHEIYVIGKNYVPDSLAVSQNNQKFTSVSNTLVDEFLCNEAVYSVVRIGFERIVDAESCMHRWETIEDIRHTCLEPGEKSVLCKKCGETEKIIEPASGHRDVNGDSLCDFCSARAFAQKAGDVIFAELYLDDEAEPAPFVCVDEDYMGSMLYVSKRIIPVQMAGAYGKHPYNESNIREWLNGAFVNALSLAGACKPFPREDGDILEDGAVLLTQAEYLKYQDFWGREGQYFTRDTDGENTVFGIAGGFAVPAEVRDETFGYRPAVLLNKPVTDEKARPVHFFVGDKQMREIGGRKYIFTCIDDDFTASQNNYGGLALFLCDSVIRSDMVKAETEKRWLTFGRTNNYKKSTVRDWLINQTKDSRFGIETVYAGVNVAAAGSTDMGAYSQLRPEQIKTMEIPFQYTNDSFFILSLDEALRYPDDLFSLGGRAPQTEASPYSSGYWLRTPQYECDDMGNYRDGNHVYVVDLVNGNLHPAGVDNPAYGIRPAFAAGQ